MGRKVRGPLSAFARMSGRAAVSLRLRNWLLVIGVAGSAAWACGASQAEERPDAPVRSVATAPIEDGVAIARACPVHRAERTFVGFSDEMSLEDFELAAIQAERILDAVKTQLCSSLDARSPDGTLSTALELGGVEVTSIVFTRADAGAADVRVRPAAKPADDDAVEHPGWQLELVEREVGWQIVPQ
jgi:hypothetical protein